jgi:hypothetical protein
LLPESGRGCASSKKSADNPINCSAWRAGAGHAMEHQIQKCMWLMNLR